VRRAAGPATGLDATLGGLLDLQDDLADTVLWLADNWSSDLPVPQAEPGGTCLDDGTVVPCLRLLVCAETAGELVEIADLLAAPVVLEGEPDAHGRRYQRATRMFGRVHMEAMPGSRRARPRWLSRRDEFRAPGKLGS
jgi:hypothetical protein